MKEQSNIVDGLGEKLSEIAGDLFYLGPEVTLAITIILVLVYDLLFKDKKEVGIFSIGFVGLVFALVISSFINAGTPFGGMFSLNMWNLTIKFLLILGGVLMLIMASRDQKNINRFGKSGELMIASLTVIMGASLMSSSTNLLMIYVAIELTSIGSYILTGIVRGRKRSEAALKYVLFGGVSSAIMIYGMSWLYGFTGTLNISDPTFFSGLSNVPILPLSIALVMTIGGFLFKLSAFPLHIWSPDVYQAAPTPVVALFSFVPKVAAIALLIQFVGAINTIDFDWQLWLGIVAIASMTVGNFSALWQKNAKRMMAYSSIAHAGFLLVGVIAFSESGNLALLFYAAVYLLMNYGAFLLISYFEKQTGSANINKLRGIGLDVPWLGVLVVIVMIALTGLPPTAGFNAKLLIFSSIWESWQGSGAQVLLWVFIIGLLNTVVALFYYLRIPYYLFFKRPEKEIDKAKLTSIDIVWGTIFVIPLLVLFFKSDWLVDFLNNINFVL